MFYYRVPVDTRLELKSKGRVIKLVDFPKGELLTERELQAWMSRSKHNSCFRGLQGCVCSCRKVIKIGKRRFEP